MFKTKIEKKGYWSKKGNDHQLGRSLVVILDFERTLRKKLKKKKGVRVKRTSILWMDFLNTIKSDLWKKTKPKLNSSHTRPTFLGKFRWGFLHKTFLSGFQKISSKTLSKL